jgi:prepilin-type processing-associated H-X9-DG protein
MFDNQHLTRMCDIKDGSSSTIAMGEGTGGGRWGVCRGYGCTTPVGTFAWPLAGGAISEVSPVQPWIQAHYNTDATIPIIAPTSSIFGTTLEPLNKNPVTETLAYSDGASVVNCLPSSQSGAALHTTSNFRSSHAGGGHFLYADGSVHFLTESIDLNLYQKLSTISGGEVISTP